jgi:hypothetical protein
MPSTSAKQKKFMRAVAHSPKFAKKVGVPQSVGKEFEMKDENKLMKKEGRGMAKADMQKVAGRAVKGHENRMHAAKKGGSVMPSKMEKVKTAAPSKDGVATKGKTKGKMVKMMKGGSCK